MNNAASGKLSTISPALVPKNAAEVDTLLNASIRVYVLAYFAYITHWYTFAYWHILHILNMFYLQAEEGSENL
jgi:hypothetical protein